MRAAKNIRCNIVSVLFLCDRLYYVIVYSLCHIFNLILEKAVFSDAWKTSHIFPVFRGGDKDNVFNYRPIALMSNFAKIFGIILSGIIYHIERYLVAEQHGFVERKSTTSHLCEFSYLISKSLNDRLEVDVAYTDSRKMFDRVTHCSLLNKLKNFGFCEELVSFVKFLVGRKEFVEHGGIKSKHLVQSLV